MKENNEKKENNENNKSKNKSFKLIKSLQAPTTFIIHRDSYINETHNISINNSNIQISTLGNTIKTFSLNKLNLLFETLPLNESYNKDIDFINNYNEENNTINNYNEENNTINNYNEENNTINNYNEENNSINNYNINTSFIRQYKEHILYINKHNINIYRRGELIYIYTLNQIIKNVLVIENQILILFIDGSLNVYIFSKDIIYNNININNNSNNISNNSNNSNNNISNNNSNIPHPPSHQVVITSNNNNITNNNIKNIQDLNLKYFHLIKIIDGNFTNIFYYNKSKIILTNKTNLIIYDLINYKIIYAFNLNIFINTIDVLNKEICVVGFIDKFIIFNLKTGQVLFEYFLDITCNTLCIEKTVNNIIDLTETNNVDLDKGNNIFICQRNKSINNIDNNINESYINENKLLNKIDILHTNINMKEKEIIKKLSFNKSNNQNIKTSNLLILTNKRTLIFDLNTKQIIYTTFAIIDGDFISNTNLFCFIKMDSCINKHIYEKESSYAIEIYEFINKKPLILKSRNFPLNSKYMEVIDAKNLININYNNTIYNLSIYKEEQSFSYSCFSLLTDNANCFTKKENSCIETQAFINTNPDKVQNTIPNTYNNLHMDLLQTQINNNTNPDKVQNIIPNTYNNLHMDLLQTQFNNNNNINPFIDIKNEKILIKTTFNISTISINAKKAINYLSTYKTQPLKVRLSQCGNLICLIFQTQIIIMDNNKMILKQFPNNNFIDIQVCLLTQKIYLLSCSKIVCFNMENKLLFEKSLSNCYNMNLIDVLFIIYDFNNENKEFNLIMMDAENGNIMRNYFNIKSYQLNYFRNQIVLIRNNAVEFVNLISNNVMQRLDLNELHNGNNYNICRLVQNEDLLYLGGENVPILIFRNLGLCDLDDIIYDKAISESTSVKKDVNKGKQVINWKEKEDLLTEIIGYCQVIKRKN
ncbi:hypothetical protein CDIK_1570 [Cucumispora dikerogammari]|nr:hypothetical protein CDIK_1570 [Cucumispora dikerogammari]